MFLSKLLKAIGHFFAHLWDSLEPEVKKAIHIGVTVTDAIKNFDANNPLILNVLTSIIPGTIDDKIVAKLRENLPKVCLELKLLDSTIGLTDPNEIMLAVCKFIQQLSGDYRADALNRLAQFAAIIAADGKLTWEDAVQVVKYYYNNKATLTVPATAPVPVATTPPTTTPTTDENTPKV